jgi:hypothetical protein
MISEGDIPSIQRKANLKGPKSMIKIDDMILNFIDFYVPILNPRLITLRPRCNFLRKLQYLQSLACYQQRELKWHQLLLVYSPMRPHGSD